MTRHPILLILVLFLTLTGCGEGKDSIFATDTKTKAKNLNNKALNEILTRQMPMDASLSFALISDSHQDYNDLEKVIDRLNDRTDLSFVVGAGDFTDLAHASEFDLFVSAISDLKAPFVTVIGNHDAIGRGPELFRRIFGPLNLSFRIQNLKLILFNNNALEFPGKIDFNWLENEIESSSEDEVVILVNHINNFSSVDFTTSQIQRQRDLIAHPNLDLVVNGHRHVFGQSEHEGTPIFQVARVREQQYAIVTIDSGVLTVQTCVRSACTEAFNVEI